MCATDWWSRAKAQGGNERLTAEMTTMSGYISPYESCTEVCGNPEQPGLALDMPLWVDHTREETTIDQAAIEAQLARFDLGGKNLLHVGVGNSKFARRFA